MINVDYIIVGDGYAAMFFAHQLIKDNKSFILFSEGKVAASHISAGVCNPVILKRFSEIWNSDPQLKYLRKIFSEIKNYTFNNYLIEEKVARIFHNENEKLIWSKKAQKDELKKYLNTEFIKLISVENTYSSGLIDQSCRVDVTRFFKDMFVFLENSNCLTKEKFEFKYLNIENSSYKEIKFGKIVFAEGIAVNDNPYFKNIPIEGNKGHCLKLKLNSEIDPYIIKKKYFLFKFDEESYYCGGTYEMDETNLEINPDSIQQLENGLKEIYKQKYEIQHVQTAFRSVVPDRRPVIGRHHNYTNMYILNGMGTRGVLNGAYFSKELYDFIENEDVINQEVDVRRFYQNA